MTNFILEERNIKEDYEPYMQNSLTIRCYIWGDNQIMNDDKKFTDI
jgi:hypothetical protein